ncbi:IS30 family transposase [Megamonas hypermegale]|uniref:IS30 family transposase n=1 Tax=Megamonas hypermegale TaxID=158847 RepID=UPI00320AB276
MYSGKFKGISFKNLRHKGKRRKKETRGKLLIGSSITTRPKDIKSRKTFGHWKLDTVVSSRGKSEACLATFVKRKTRFYVAIKIKDRTAPSMLKAIKKLVKIHYKKGVKNVYDR